MGSQRVYRPTRGEEQQVVVVPHMQHLLRDETSSQGLALLCSQLLSMVQAMQQVASLWDVGLKRMQECGPDAALSVLSARLTVVM